MNPRLRQAIILTSVGLLSVWFAWQIAEESYVWPVLAVAVGLAAFLVKITKLPFDIIVLGLVMFGYIVGNRGFAQLTPTPSLPLLPAEGTLLIAGSWWILRSAFARRLPWSPDGLSRLVLAWMVLGSARMLFDLRTYGFLAIRDFAMVYYALYYFIAVRLAVLPNANKYLTMCLLWGSLLILPGSLLFEAFPHFFMTTLTLRGTPLVYYKGDLVFMYVAAGSLLMYFLAPRRHHWWASLCSAAYFLYLAGGNNRASLLGALFCAGLLLAARRWRYPAMLGNAVAAAVLVLVMLSVVFQVGWAERKISSATDRILSLTDIAGVSRYESDESGNKGDNNRFRLIWWGTVVRDTWQGNPIFGLGFGYDLARSFVHEYSPDASEEFTTRSPHNVFLSVFGRMGIAGLALWLAICAVLLSRTWEAFRWDEDTTAWALWGCLWVILVTAALGVVLEGPMGAVPFWIILGLANARSQARTLVADASN